MNLAASLAASLSMSAVGMFALGLLGSVRASKVKNSLRESRPATDHHDAVSEPPALGLEEDEPDIPTNQMTPRKRAALWLSQASSSMRECSGDGGHKLCDGSGDGGHKLCLLQGSSGKVLRVHEEAGSYALFSEALQRLTDTGTICSLLLQPCVLLSRASLAPGGAPPCRAAACRARLCSAGRPVHSLTCHGWERDLHRVHQCSVRHTGHAC